MLLPYALSACHMKISLWRLLSTSATSMGGSNSCRRPAKAIKFDQVRKDPPSLASIYHPQRSNTRHHRRIGNPVCNQQPARPHIVRQLTCPIFCQTLCAASPQAHVAPFQPCVPAPSSHFTKSQVTCDWTRDSVVTL